MAELTHEEMNLEISKAVNLLTECMEINKIPVIAGLSAMQSLIASAFKKTGNYEYYKDATLEMLEQAEKQWNSDD